MITMRLMENQSLDSLSFIAALETASKPNYLGNPQVLDTMLREFVQAAMDRRANLPHEEAFQTDVAECLRLANVMLGRDPTFTPMPGWNRVGVIDCYIAKRLNVTGANPQEVVANVFVECLISFYELLNYMDTPDVPEGNWNWQPDAIIEIERNVLMGIEFGEDE